MRTIRLISIILALSLLGDASAGVKVVELRNEHEAAVQGIVKFSHLNNQKQSTDRDGDIRLAQVHDKSDQIEVCPKDSQQYGGCFPCAFPKRDGLVVVPTLAGAHAAERSIPKYEEKGLAKVAAALASILSEFFAPLDSERATSLKRKAFQLLHQSYDIRSPQSSELSPALRDKVIGDSTVTEKPTAETWTSVEFLNIAGRGRSELILEAIKSTGIGLVNR